MNDKYIYFVDVTNRDGVQTSRLGLAKLQKTIINLMLNELGITQSEFGFPTTKHELNYLNGNLDLVDMGVINKTKLSAIRSLICLGSCLTFFVSSPSFESELFESSMLLLFFFDSLSFFLL